MTDEKKSSKRKHLPWWSLLIMGLVINWGCAGVTAEKGGIIVAAVNLVGSILILVGIVEGLVALYRKVAKKEGPPRTSVGISLLMTIVVPASLGIVLLSMIIGASFFNQLSQASSTPAPVETVTYPLATRDELLKLVNEERGKAGVEPLIESNELDVSAQFKADDLANRNYFTHEDPTTGKHNGIEKAFELTGAFCSYISENMRSGTGMYSTSQATVDGWMSSPAHREALLAGKYSYTGIGVAQGKDGTMYAVEHFCQK